VPKDIIERTDGIPLFVEEMTKAVFEAESQRAVRACEWRNFTPVPAVPASLHASLLERLDRLGPAKQLAQIGAAIGREFPHALLAAVARKLEAQLNVALESSPGRRLAVPAGRRAVRGPRPHQHRDFLVAPEEWREMALPSAAATACPNDAKERHCFLHALAERQVWRRQPKVRIVDQPECNVPGATIWVATVSHRSKFSTTRGTESASLG
jgi:hypothetical protein